MNNTHLVGNVGRHPELRYTTSGTAVANVTLATNRVYRDRAGDRQQTTEWHRLVVWGEGAENFARIVGTGDLLAVRGRLEYKLREIAGGKVQDAVVRVLEWSKLSPRKTAAEAEPTAAGDTGEETAEGLTLESEIEGGTFEGDEALTTDSAPAETAAAPAEEIPTEQAPEEAATTPARRRKK